MPTKRCDSSTDGDSPDEKRTLFFFMLSGIFMTSGFSFSHPTKEVLMQKKQSFTQKNRDAVRYTVFVALFVALAYAVTFVFHLKVSFLTFDAKDAVITIAAFLFGPLSGALISLMVAIIENISIGGTGLWGLLMDFISTASFAVSAALIYKRHRTIRGAVVSLGVASVFTVAVMMLANLLITPLYMGVDVATVKTLIPTLLLPFNVAKALLNSAVTMLLYKPVSLALRHAHLLPEKRMQTGSKSSGSFGKGTIVTVLVAAALIAISVVIFLSLDAKLG